MYSNLEYFEVSSPKDCEEIGHLYYKTFSVEEPLDTLSKVSENPAIMEPLFKQLILDFCTQGGVLFAAKDITEGRIVGFICGLPYGMTQNSEAYEQVCRKSPAQYKLLGDLETMAEANNSYSRFLNGRITLYIHLAGVEKQWSGNGIAHHLFHLIESDAKASGFTCCAMAATAIGSQAIGTKNGWICLAEIKYASFRHNSDPRNPHPFATIERPPSVKFMLKEL